MLLVGCGEDVQRLLVGCGEPHVSRGTGYEPQPPRGPLVYFRTSCLLTGQLCPKDFSTRRAPGPDRLPLPLEQRLLVGCGEDVFKIFFVG